MATLQQATVERAPRRLLDHGYDRYSSTGNDGIIAEIFRRLGRSTGTFVEFGAWDGVHLSNCRRLYEEGWSGIFLEGDAARFAQLRSNYAAAPQIVCLHAEVAHDRPHFDDLVRPFVRDGIDFCSIDIDGLDLEVFETIVDHRPDVVCIEGGQMLHPLASRVRTEIARHNIQQSLSCMVEAFAARGYRLLCTHQDSFFVKAELGGAFEPCADVVEAYLRGLRHHPRRIPWIRGVLATHGLRNEILDDILERSGTRTVTSGKEWSDAELDAVLEAIEATRRAPEPAATQAKEHLRVWDRINDLEQFREWFERDSAPAIDAAVAAITAHGCRSLLEVGPGLLHFHDALLGVTPDIAYTGIEVSEVFLRHAHDRGVAVQPGDVEALEFADGAFEAAYARHVLLHQPTFLTGLAELIRVSSRLVVVDFASTDATRVSWNQQWSIYKNSYAARDIENFVSLHPRVAEYAWIHGPYRPEAARVIAIALR